MIYVWFLVWLRNTEDNRLTDESKTEVFVGAIAAGETSRDWALARRSAHGLGRSRPGRRKLLQIKPTLSGVVHAVDHKRIECVERAAFRSLRRVSGNF